MLTKRTPPVWDPDLNPPFLFATACFAFSHVPDALGRGSATQRTGGRGCTKVDPLDGFEGREFLELGPCWSRTKMEDPDFETNAPAFRNAPVFRNRGASNLEPLCFETNAAWALL